MKRNRLTEKEIKNLVKNTINEEQELDEILNFGNIYHGVRGLYKGEGYDYYRFLSKLKNRSGYLEYALNYAENEFNFLKSLYEKIQNSNFNPEKKKSLLILIDPIITKWESCFKPISDNVKEIKQIVSDKLSNKIDDIETTNNDSTEKPIDTKDKGKKIENKPTDPGQRFSSDDDTNNPPPPPPSTNQINNDDDDSNTPGWDNTIKEEIKRFKNLLK